MRKNEKLIKLLITQTMLVLNSRNSMNYIICMKVFIIVFIAFYDSCDTVRSIIEYYIQERKILR